MAIASRCASISVLYGDGMNGFRHLREEVPHGCRIEKVLDWVRFHGMKEVWSLHWISNIEHWEADS